MTGKILALYTVILLTKRYGKIRAYLCCVEGVRSTVPQAQIVHPELPLHRDTDPHLVWSNANAENGHSLSKGESFRQVAVMAGRK